MSKRKKTIDQAQARRRDGESIADALGQLGAEQELVELAGELMDEGLGSDEALRQAERLLPLVLDFAQDWDRFASRSRLTLAA